ncbi:MAG: hypothetical protein OWR62_15240 [Sulfobacillus thermotolerans]|nr:hypothetical protein [Sulfobacillus thermotolerans]
MPSSIHIVVDGGHWWLSFAAEDPAVTMPAKTVDAAIERMAEDLRIQNMTKRPQAQQDAHGRFLPNKAAAKGGLNRAILSSSWGQVVLLTTYKALRHGKLVITVPRI